MTDFGRKKTVFLTLKLRQATSQPHFGVGTSSLDIMYLSIAFCGWRKILLRMTDFGLKTAFLTVKVCQAVSQSPFGVGTSYLNSFVYSALMLHMTKLSG